MKIIATCLSVLVLSWLHGCAVVDVYNVRGMEGNVVDKATGKPLEGVMVIEAWEIYKPGLHGTSGGYLPLRETRTDSDGHYRFSARGTLHIDGGYLDETSPWMIYYKPGYLFNSVMNEIYPDQRLKFFRKSDWDGKTIELEQFYGASQEYAIELERFGGVLDKFNRGEWCKWMDIPETLSLLHQEFTRLQREGVRANVAIGASRVTNELKKCPESDRFFEVYKE